MTVFIMQGPPLPRPLLLAIDGLSWQEIFLGGYSLDSFMDTSYGGLGGSVCVVEHAVCGSHCVVCVCVCVCVCVWCLSPCYRQGTGLCMLCGETDGLKTIF